MPDEPTQRRRRDRTYDIERLFRADNDNLTEDTRLEGRVMTVAVHRDLITRVDGDELLAAVRAAFAREESKVHRVYNALTYGFVRFPGGEVRFLYPRRKQLPTVEEVAVHYGWTVESVEKEFRRGRNLVEQELRDRALID